MSKYDSDYLITQIKRRGSFPSSQNLFTNTKLILMLDDELKTRIVPYLMAFMDNHYITYYEYTGDGSTLSFKIPDNAVGGKLKDVSIYQDGEPRYSPIQRIETQNLYLANYGYLIEDNYIRLYPASKVPNSSQKIRLTYYERVSDIVATSEGREISNITGDDVDSATTLPATFVTGADVQIVSATSPFKILWTGSISNVSGTTITLDSTPTNCSVGDWICLSGESVFAQIPLEVIPLLCQAVVARCLSAMLDTEGLKIAMQDYEQMANSIRITLSPKVDSGVKKILAPKRLQRFL